MYGTAASLYGTAPTYIGSVPADTAHTATDAATRGLMKISDSPALWLLGIVLVTVGAAGVAGSFRLGPAKIAGAIGKAS